MHIIKRKGCPYHGQRWQKMEKEIIKEDIVRDVDAKLSDKEASPKQEFTTPPSGGWGDAEHDTRIHRNLQPHSCPPSYDAEWQRYRTEE